MPKIRSDRRITVFYPIYNGRTRIGQGLFPGDGEGNPPSTLTFSEGEVYVNPIEGYGCYDKIDTAYYMHGNLYATNYGITCKTPSNITVREHKLTFNEWSVSYPVVKIGSGYWTRTYISKDMKFGYYNRSTFIADELVVDNILFANIYETNASAFMSANKGIYGPDADEVYGERCLWYLPLASDRQNLTEYLGKNLKSLFKGQPSGFDAQFEGYFGVYDTGGNLLDYETRRDQGKKCYVPFKKSVASSNGEALILSPDYTWTKVNTSSLYNYYPVRLFRTAYFTHKNL